MGEEDDFGMRTGADILTVQRIIVTFIADLILLMEKPAFDDS